MGMQNDKLNREYALRLHEIATQTYPYVFENKLIITFINTLKALYYGYLIGDLSTYFIKVSEFLERGEQDLKLGSIMNLVVKFDVMLDDKSKEGSYMGNTYQNHFLPQHPIQPSWTSPIFTSLTASTPFLKINIPPPLKDVN
jgi:hypothetical protein